MLHRLLAFLVFLLFLSQLLYAKKPTPPRPLHVSLTLKNWGIKDPNKIQLGQLGILKTSKGPQLQVYNLRTKLPKVPKLRIRSKKPPHQGACFLLSDFEMGHTNRLGGFYNHFQKAPSSAQVGIEIGPDKRPALSLSYDRRKKGFCGFWMHLFDFKAPLPARTYLDASPFKWLVFWVRGRTGLEQIKLKVADAYWEKKGDALPIGMLHKFLPKQRITRTWQLAKIPLRTFPPRVKRSQLASIVFEGLDGKGQIDLKTAAFCQPTTSWPTLPPPPQKRPARTKSYAKATWLWETQPYLDSTERQERLLKFLRLHHFSDLFIQLPKRPKALNKAWPKQLQEQKWRRFLTKVRRHKVRVYALEGYKGYALPKWHPRVKETVQQVIDYNRSVPQHARFDGVRYDIEPYLLPGFRGNKRKWVMTQYLTLLQALKKMCQQAGLHFGVDVPFWFDANNPQTGRPDHLIFKGKRKLMSEHIIDQVDDIGIMDYRTRAYGADGIVVHASQELIYASQTGKRVFVGLETLPLPHERLVSFKGLPTSALPKTPPSTHWVIAMEPPKVGRMRLHLVPGSAWSSWKQTHQKTLKGMCFWSVSRSIYVSSNKISFAHLGAKRLHTAMKQAEREFARYSSFTGFAIHSIHSYKALLHRPPKP